MRKRILAILLTAAMLMSMFPVVLAQANEDLGCYIHGDINGDGVVDSKDAVYTLFHSIPLFEKQYPIDQDCDFNKDTVVNSKDAIYLMYAAMPEYAEEYTLDGTIHRFLDPAWVWTADEQSATAEVNVTCGCGQSHTFTTENGVNVVTGIVVDATCVDAGSKEYLATVVIGGQTLTATYEVELPAGNGHVINENAGCEEDAVCENCDYKVTAKGHSWVLDDSKFVPATCTANAKYWYTCACGETKQIVEEGTAGHDLAYKDTVCVEGCTYAKRYACQADGCDYTENLDTYTQHTYEATLTAEPNCTHAGEKKYTCTVCGDSYTESVAANGVHVWDNGTEANGVITYSCAYCGTTKTSAVVQQNQAITTDTLQSTSDLKLHNDTVVSLDEATVNGLDTQKNIIISVEQVDAAQTGLTQEQQAQVGENPVYDFSMHYDDADNTAVTDFEGYVTISLPYTLEEGEDVDSIDVWYVADNGQLTRMQGTYSNGFVTFATNHFSYYTVTRLTPQERCERYGHVESEVVTAPSCTQDGFTLKVCARCGNTEKTNVQQKTGHNYQNTGNCSAATCTASGLIEQYCDGCQTYKRQTLAATGHTVELVADKSKESTCTENGVEAYACQCGYSYELTLPTKSHSYKTTGTVAPTCGAKGYDQLTCETCGKEIIRNEKSALGHNYQETQNSWKWSDDYKSATVTLVCGNDASHEKVLDAAVSEKLENSVCMGGAVTYTAAASFNGVTYTKVVTTALEGAGHIPSNRWNSDETNHSHTCVVCDEVIDVQAHTMEKNIVKTPTCNTMGTVEDVCTVCGYTKSTPIAATGIHTYVSGVCVHCGVKEVGCDHEMNIKTELDLSEYGTCGGKITMMTCACGEKNYMLNQQFKCHWVTDSLEPGKTEDGQTIYREVMRCSTCGLERHIAQYKVVNKEQCSYVEMYDSTLKLNGQEILSYAVEEWEGIHPVNPNGVEVDMGQYGFCDGYLVTSECYCGLRKTVNTSNMGCEWEYDEATNTWACAACGGVNTGSYSHKEEGCCFIGTGKEIFTIHGKTYTFDDQYVEVMHDWKTDEYKLQGKTCEEGLYFKQTCQACGKTEEETVYDHFGLSEKEQDLSGYQFCSDVLIRYNCPCGQTCGSYFIGENYCNWYYEGEYRRVCSNCGMTAESTVIATTKDESCNVENHLKTVYTDVNGKSFETEEIEYDSQHDYECSYELQGASCTQGVEIVQTCRDCGFSSSYTTYYHEWIDQSSCDLSQFGGCNTKVTYYECACGNETGWYWEDSDCDFEWVSEDNDSYTDKCTKCGITRKTVYGERHVVDACHYYVDRTHIFSKDGTELFRQDYKEHFTTHRTVATMTLKEGATSCSDGYHITNVCQNCNEVTSDYDGSSQDHPTWCTKREQLLQTSCGYVEKTIWSCPCGEESGTGIDYNCNFTYSHEENGYSVHKCENCGLIKKWKESRQDIPGENCFYTHVNNYVFVLDGKTVAAAETTSRQPDHWYEYTFQLQGETCKDGYTANGVCKKCGDTVQHVYEGSGWHEWYAVEYVDLTDVSSCGGYLRYYQCACGQESSVENYDSKCSMYYNYWEDADISGNVHSYSTNTCRKCGMVKKTESYTIAGEGCDVEHHTQYNYTLGNWSKSFDLVNIDKLHEWKTISATLREGAQTCEDGVHCATECIHCGAREEWVTHSHATTTAQTIDLAPYGAICGTQLELKKCACGAENYYEIVGNCDVDYYSAESWIPDVLSESQHTSEGWIECYSYFYEPTCAVTHPNACGLKLRMANYWVKEGCEAVQYQVWQLGYDQTTGTCQKELKIATGRHHGFHDYECSDTSREVDANTRIEEYTYLCSDCGSSYVHSFTYVNNLHQEERLLFINKLSNGENRQRLQINTTGIHYQGHSRITQQRGEIIRADGSLEWYEYNYAYASADKCQATVTYTNSDGESWTQTQNQHSTYGTYETVKEATCTQHGEYIETWVCQICAEVTNTYTYKNNPTAHSWNWNADKQTYVCGVCGLENINGASGGIVLEDLTDSYGNGSKYVVGYWNRNAVKTNSYVSVILADVAADQNNELVLTGITFENWTVDANGVRAVAFDKTVALQKAAQAVADAGYTGEYAIRISFVPVDGKDTLDYAVTFDSVNAE